MIAAAGVAGVRPGFAEEDPAEIQGWQACIGETFTFGRPRSLRDIVPKMVLVDVVEFNAPDPDRPEDFRAQFTLLFEPAARSRIVEDGTYSVMNSLAGRIQLYINRIQPREPGGVTYQAVFS